MSSITHLRTLLSSTTILILIHQISAPIHHNQEVALRACWPEMASASSGPLLMGPRRRFPAIPHSLRRGSSVRKTSTGADIQKICENLKSSKNPILKGYMGSKPMQLPLSQLIEPLMNKHICIVTKCSLGCTKMSKSCQNHCAS